MAYDEGLAERIREHLPKEVVEKKMFGGLGFMLRGNMVGGILKNELIVRVGPEGYEACLKKPHAKTMTRPMRGFVMVEAAGYEEDDALDNWLKRGLEYALTLPPK